MEIRPFVWTDLGAYVRLLNTRTVVEPVTEDEARDSLGQPTLRPERNLFLAQAGNEAVGYVLVVPEYLIHRTILEGAVAPQWRRRGTGSTLLRHGLAHSRLIGAHRAHVSTTSDNEPGLSFLRRNGFTEVRRQWRMGRAGPRLGVARLAAGHLIRRLTKDDLNVLTRLQNRSFAESWGYNPNTPEDEEYRVRMNGGRFEDVLMLFVDERPAAFCWTRVRRSGERRIGVVWMIGTDPECRGQNLGREILLDALEALYQRGVQEIELTVYADNAAAIRLYDALGFEKSGEIVWFEKDLREAAYEQPANSGSAEGIPKASA